MKRFGRKNSLKQLVFSKITLVFLLVLAAYLAMGTYERFAVERNMAARRAEIEARYEKLKERKLTLEEKVEYLRGDTGIEAEIRNHFDVAKEGEQVVIIVDDETDSGLGEENDSTPEVSAEPWYKFW